MVIDVSAMLVAMMYFLVPTGNGKKILFWSYKGNDE